MPLQTLKVKIRKFATALQFDQYDLAALEEITSVNDPIRGMTLLDRVLDSAHNNEQVYDLIPDLQSLQANLSPTELFERYEPSQLNTQRSSQNSKIFICTVNISSKKRKTSVEITRAPISTIFKEAVENYAKKWVEFLIDRKYISNYQSSLTLPNESFASGFWIRHFPQNAIKNEVNSLMMRKDLSKKSLRGHVPQGSSTSTNSFYSPATFISPGYNIFLFGGVTHHTGVILLPQNRTIDYWYSGLQGEELSRDFNYSVDVLKEYRNNKDGHHFREITEEEIAGRYPGCVQNSLDHKRVKMDKYGVIERTAPLPWNEGLFRYQAQDISGILVEPSNTQSISAAFELRNSLIKRFTLTPNQLPYYSYDRERRSLIPKSSPELKEILKDTQQLQLTGPPKSTIFGR